MPSLEKKLNNPPYVHNFVRYLDETEEKTTKNLVSFAKGKPISSYVTGNKIVKDRVNLKINRSTALKACDKIATLNRAMNTEYVTAFLDHDEEIGISRRQAYDQFVSPFRVSSDCNVPVKPLSITALNNRLHVMFSFGWQSNPLSRFQIRMMMTMLEDAVFTLTDFRNAEGELFFFPRQKKDDKESRKAQIIRRGDFELYTTSQMREYLDIYLSALSKAKEILRSEPQTDESDSRNVIHIDPRQMRLL